MAGQSVRMDTIQNTENEFQNGTRLRSRHELLHSAHSESTKANIKLARRLLTTYARQKHVEDPRTVNENSSVFVLNLLADYCKFGTPKSLRNDSMGAIVQGLRIVYCEHGHDQHWHINSDGSAVGNPHIGNPDLERLRRAHRVHLARFGNLTSRARPLTVNHVCDIAERFWYGCERPVEIMDTALHCILVVGLNLGLRFDEISKIRVDNVSVWSGGVQMSLCESIKNSTVQRNYELREWEGNTDLRHSVFMDPFTSLYAWLSIRGCISGPLFCDIRCTKEGQFLDPSKPWSAKSFTSFFRRRLCDIGVGREERRMFTGHSIKRGSVQLYRSLGLKDEMIMEIIQMKGFNAYANYCAAYNDCSPSQLPRFSSVQDYIAHARTIVDEANILDVESYFTKWMEDMDMKEDN